MGSLSPLKPRGGLNNGVREPGSCVSRRRRPGWLRVVVCLGVLACCSLARLVLDGEFRCAKQNGWAVRSRVVGQQEDGRLRSGRGIPRQASLLDGWVLVAGRFVGEVSQRAV
jgi:hypothetical protein